VLCCCELSASGVCAKVSDYAELPLHDARVTVTDLQTNKLRTARTDRSGVGCVSGIPEGLYSVEVGQAGFLNVRYYPVHLAPLVTQQLQFRLPFGEITEGGIAGEAVLSGTLRQGEAPIAGVTICFSSGGERDPPAACTATDDIGEYAVSLPPGSYRVEVRVPGAAIQRSIIEVPSPGLYRNRITLQLPKEARH
jgi:hypothetical protein